MRRECNYDTIETMMQEPMDSMSRTALEQTALEQAADYALVAQAIAYLEAHFQEQPGLDELAAQLHISPFHLQRVFTRWAGISPKRFLQFLTVNYAKGLLEESRSVLEAAYGAGLSGPGRLHDLFVTLEAVTPGEYKEQGAGLEIAYGRHATPFGEALLAATARGVCALHFLDHGGQGLTWDEAILALRLAWPAALLRDDPAATAPLAARIFQTAPGVDPAPLRLLVKGTNFQVKVWSALLRVPMGAVCTYADLAQAIEQPSAARAVGSAVGSNPIAYLIPCHRVIRAGGLVRDYRWGAARKKAMLGWEAARRALHDSKIA
ncbi:MAG TPA: methylated-DNA--[protein]-cysteine S-methyltransferase [Caldilineaceae bacterium]|nr:methylated-DNA--[protein]-cysteine S-methyltransferase [Caldilineaceae bacterium]